MCGRLNVKKSVDPAVKDELGVEFDSIENDDLRPTQRVAVVHSAHGQLSQINPRWGIQPDWANKLIINAQSESIQNKRTFSQAYAMNRCVVPCSGWYEWQGERGSKTKYHFSGTYRHVLYMAGILFSHDQIGFELVTLTRKANSQCEQYHHRMPYLLEAARVGQWLSSTQLDLEALSPSNAIELHVT